jgi:hypothetical protein
VQLVQKLESRGIPCLSEADSVRFESARSKLRRSRLPGSVGRRWANSPITAHPKRRMRSIPLRVVQLSAQGAQVRTLKPWQAEIAQFTCDREAIDSAGKEQAESSP